MKSYTTNEVSHIKREIRTGKPCSIIADELSTIWKRPYGGIYNKVLNISKLVNKKKNTWNGPSKRTYTRKPKPAMASNVNLWNWDNEKEAVAVKEICEEIVAKSEEVVEEVNPTETGIEVPANLISFNSSPTRVVIYSDHVRYYYN